MAIDHPVVLTAQRHAAVRVKRPAPVRRGLVVCHRGAVSGVRGCVVPPAPPYGFGSMTVTVYEPSGVTTST